ncbi:MAG: chemotaxis protein CheA [Candidatus Eremiobacterota bacterium]
MDEYSKVFKEEAYELLTELESSLLELEDSPEDMELIGRVFRAMHTLKGCGAMFGFENIAEFTHDIETVFDLVRNEEIKVTIELIDLTLEARDQIRLMLEEPSGGDPVDKDKCNTIISSLRTLMPGQKEKSSLPAADAVVETLSAASCTSSVNTYLIHFAPDRNIFMMGTNPVYLIDELAGLGECKIFAFRENIPELSVCDPELCYTGWNIILTSEKELNDIKDIFIFVEDSCQLKIDIIDKEDASNLEEKYRSEKVQEEYPVEPVKIEQKIETVPEKISSARGNDKPLPEPADSREKKKPDDQASSIRVSSDKLDKLVDLVGELVIVQARLTQTANEAKKAGLTAIAEDLERLTVELRDHTLDIRMLPIGTTFGKFKRLVRDLSKELGKEVEMTTDGAETELDKTVIERLNDPLVHLIRNSIDHGIESPEIRKSMGKPSQGIIHLSALHAGASVLIKIEDDGAGLDKEVIYNKALERGIISPDTEMSEEEVFGLIFAPGFSTAKKITNVSGRGVGMDVVKRCIDGLGGSIEVSSTKGYGTIITLKLPLTLAIIEGLLVKIGNDFYVLPLASVEECVELTRTDIEMAHGRHIINVRGEIVPYISLKEIFSIDAKEREIEQVVVTRMNGQRVGLVVDQVIGEHQTVIKTLGKVYQHAKGLSGATILGDGTVALILDVNQLVKDAEFLEVEMSA